MEDNDRDKKARILQRIRQRKSEIHKENEEDETNICEYLYTEKINTSIMQKNSDKMKHGEAVGISPMKRIGSEDNSSIYTRPEKKDTETIRSLGQPEEQTSVPYAVMMHCTGAEKTTKLHVHASSSFQPQSTADEGDALKQEREICRWVDELEQQYPPETIKTAPRDTISIRHLESTSDNTPNQEASPMGSVATVLVRLISVVLYSGKKNFFATIQTSGESICSCRSSETGTLCDVFLMQTKLGTRKKIDLQIHKNKKHGLTKKFMNAVFGGRKECAQGTLANTKQLGSFCFEFVSEPHKNICGTYYIRKMDGERVGEVTMQTAIRTAKPEMGHDEIVMAMQSYLSVLREDSGVVTWKRYWVSLETKRLQLHFYDFETKTNNLFSLELAPVIGVERLDSSVLALENVFKVTFEDDEVFEFYSDAPEISGQWIKMFRKVLWGLKT